MKIVRKVEERFMSFGKKLKEFFRKRIVHLKKKPQVIPLICVIISCMVYTFKLSNYSNAAIYSSDSWVAVLVFVTTLFSILSIFTYMGGYDRKKVKMPMIVLAVFLLVVLFACDYLCFGSISAKIASGSERAELIQAKSDLIKHMIWLGISIVLIVTKPLYHKLLLKINTSVTDSEFDD